VTRYLVVAFEAADHAGDLVDQAEVMDEVLQILVQLTGAHVQLVFRETHTSKTFHKQFPFGFQEFTKLIL